MPKKINVEEVNIVEETPEQKAENKITISELKEHFGYDTDTLFETRINVKKHIPFSVKLFIVDRVTSLATEENDGITKIKYADKMFWFDTFILATCTNIAIPEPFEFEDYDYLKSSGIMDHVIASINVNDYYTLGEIIDLELEQKLKLSNSLESIVRDGLNKIINKIPDEKGMKALMKNLPTMINKIDLERLDLVKSVVGFNKGEK